MKIWIDLANSPQVLFFRPIVAELLQQGHAVTLTARVYAQTTQLAAQLGLPHTIIGKHGGRRLRNLVVENFLRSLALARWARGQSFDLAASHNSYSQAVAAFLLGIPFVTSMDYEHQPLNHISFRLARRVIVPEAFPAASLRKYGAAERAVTYPGIKEQIYLHDFTPETNYLQRIGIPTDKPVVVIRPPAPWTAYHRSEGDLFDSLLSHLADQNQAYLLFLPRIPSQAESVRRILHVNVANQDYDGPNLLYHANVSISGGGTMNREAAVLGTPTFTVFKGELGAVDQYLINLGRMKQVTSPSKFNEILAQPINPERSRLAGPALVKQITNQILTTVSPIHSIPSPASLVGVGSPWSAPPAISVPIDLGLGHGNGANGRLPAELPAKQVQLRYGAESFLVGSRNLPPDANPTRPAALPSVSLTAGQPVRRVWPAMTSFISAWGWLILLGASPLILFPNPAQTLALLLIPACMIIFRTGERAAITRSALDWPILLTAVMVLVSLYATFDIGYSLSKVGGLALGIGLYYAVLSAIGPSGTRLLWAVVAYLGLGGSIAALALISTDWPNRVGVISSLIAYLPWSPIRLPGAQAGLHFNEVAGVMLWIAPLGLAVAMAWRKQVWPAPLAGKWSRLAASVIPVVPAGAAALACFVLMLAQSRGGWASLTIGLFLMAAIIWRRGRLVVLAAFLALIAVGAIWLSGAGAALTATLGVGNSPQAAIRGITSILQGRLEIWSSAISAIQDFPFTGLGLNAFRKVVHILYPLQSVSTDDINSAHAHNHWLQVAVDLGLAGLIAHLTTWLLTLAMLLRVYRRSTQPLLRAISLGVLGSLGSYFIFGMFDTVSLGARPGLLWWMLLALASLSWRHAAQAAGTRELAPSGRE